MEPENEAEPKDFEEELVGVESKQDSLDSDVELSNSSSESSGSDSDWMS